MENIAPIRVTPDLFTKQVFIYGLKDPTNDQIRYIGKTNNLSKRIGDHITEKRKHRKNNWIKKLHREGLKPELVVIDQCDESNWKEFEIHYIRLFKSFGARLLNKTNGGDWTPDSTGEKNGNWGMIGELNHRSKSVLVYNSNGDLVDIVGSMRQASKKYCVDFSSVVRSCKGTLWVVGGYCFKYNNGDAIQKIEVKKKLYPSGVNHPCAIQVNHFDKNGVFVARYDSITHASKITGMTIGSIRNILSKKVTPRKNVFRTA